MTYVAHGIVSGEFNNRSKSKGGAGCTKCQAKEDEGISCNVEKGKYTLPVKQKNPTLPISKPVLCALYSIVHSPL